MVTLTRSGRPGPATCPTILLFALSLLILSPGCGGRNDATGATNPLPPAESRRDFKVIHAYVALCDNASQGISPVPAGIGDGNDPATNLYWGCTDGARSFFGHSGLWGRVSAGTVEAQPEILERLVFQHKQTRSILVIDAWRGSEIQSCIRQFCLSIAGQHYESHLLKDSRGEHRFNLGGGADFLAYIGHNGLMEFQVPALPANPNRKQSVDVAILCCKSRLYFENHVSAAGARPVVMTSSNMYPGAFILHDVLEGWLAGGDPGKLRLRAAKAYAGNQGITTRSALSVFAELP